jgi:hypothetical protein
MNLIRANAVFAIYQQPNRRKPLLQCDRRILKNRSHLQGELLAWVSAAAAVEPRFFKVGNFISAALWAAHLAIGPANCDHELAAVLEVTEVLNGFLECLWVFHAVNLA